MKVLYDYEAQDLDELTIKEGELIDLVKEGLSTRDDRTTQMICISDIYLYICQPTNTKDIAGQSLLLLSSSDESGWWTGKVGGKEGFFPGAYVEKV